MTYQVPAKVNIRNVKEIHGEILIYCKDNTAIEIDLDGCEDADLSLIQLIESVRKTAAAQSRRVSLTKPANDMIRSTLERAGLFESFKSDDARFWLHQEVM